MYEKRKNILSLVLNAVVFLTTTVLTVGNLVLGADESQPGFQLMVGLGTFRAFTQDSNVLAGLAAGVMVVFNVNNLFEKKNEMPRWAVLFHHLATVSVAVTFVTVALFLAPFWAILQGDALQYFFLFTGSNFYFHLVGPLLSMASLVFCANRHVIGKKWNFVCVIPTVVYSVVYLIAVVFLKTWDDFYGFTFGGRYGFTPFVVLLMWGMTWLLAFLLGKLHNKVAVIEVFPHEAMTE